jgi:hypothetical protein
MDRHKPELPGVIITVDIDRSTVSSAVPIELLPVRLAMRLLNTIRYPVFVDTRGGEFFPGILCI